MDKKADLYVLFHRPVEYGIWDDELWTPLQVGTYGKNRILENGFSDDTGDNISGCNRLYCETTGLYWIWKNGLTGKKYAGQTQFRRRIDIHTEEELDKIFADYDVIATSPIFYFTTVKESYGRCHNIEDIEMCERIVKKLYPDYCEDWDNYITNGKFLFYSNGFVMREEEYRKYCEWLFPIFGKFTEEMGWMTMNDVVEYVKKQIEEGKRPNIDGSGKQERVVDYQCEIFGFLSERLWTLYLLHNFESNRIFLMDYLKYEGV